MGFAKSITVLSALAGMALAAQANVKMTFPKTFTAIICDSGIKTRDFTWGHMGHNNRWGRSPGHYPKEYITIDNGFFVYKDDQHSIEVKGLHVDSYQNAEDGTKLVFGRDPTESEKIVKGVGIKVDVTMTVPK